MPVEKNDLDDRIIVRGDKESEELILRSYGLPMVFWGYLLALFAVIFFMILAIKGPLMKVLTGEDTLNMVIGISVLALLTLGPITLLGFFFYEKEIAKRGKALTVTHKIFYIPVKRYQANLSQGSLELEHFLDSPNMAAQQKKDGMAGFENRGYFKLILKSENGKTILIDRNGRRGEMRKLKELLES